MLRSRNILPLFVALFSAALILRWNILSDVYVTWDDGEYWLATIRLLKSFESHGFWQMLVDAYGVSSNRPNLMPLLGLPFLALAHREIQTADLLFTSTFTFLAAYAMTSFLRRFLKDSPIAGIASFFLMTSSNFFWGQTMFMSELPYCTFLLLALAFGIRNTPRSRILSGLFLGLALCMRPYEGALLLTVVGGLSAALWRKEIWKMRNEWRAALQLVLPMVAVALFWFLPRFHELLIWANPDLMNPQLAGDSFFSYLAHAFGGLGINAVIPISLLAIAGKKPKYLILGAAQLIAPLAVLWLVYEEILRNTYERFLMFNFLFFFILALYPIASARKLKDLGFVVLAVLSLMNLAAIFSLRASLGNEYQVASSRVAVRRSFKVEHLVWDELLKVMDPESNARIFTLVSAPDAVYGFSRTNGALLTFERRSNWEFILEALPLDNAWNTGLSPETLSYMNRHVDFFLIGPIGDEFHYYPLAKDLLDPKKRGANWREERRFAVTQEPNFSVTFILLKNVRNP